MGQIHIYKNRLSLYSLKLQLMHFSVTDVNIVYMYVLRIQHDNSLKKKDFSEIGTNSIAMLKIDC